MWYGLTLIRHGLRPRHPSPFCPFGTFPPDRGNRPSPWQGEGSRFYAYDTNLKEVVSSMKKLFCIAAALALLAVLALRFCSKGRESWET